MYGENGAVLRSELAALLRHQRGQQKLTGSTPLARAERGLLVRQYRQNVLIWMCQAMRAAAPMAYSNMPPIQPNPFRAAGTGGAHLSTAGELARAVDLATRSSSAQPAPVAALTAPCGNEMVEHWRLAARAAALAEHDTTTEMSTNLTTQQAQALVGDVAAMTQALVVLDQRSRSTPGWEPLVDATRLGWASLAAALDVNLGQPDYAIDHLGWRPNTKIIPGPGRPGILGVLQAQHNLVIRMRSVPTATNLRLVVDSQRLLSAGLAPLVADTDNRTAERWHLRADTYGLLQRQLRDIGGLLGKGGLAVAEGANAVSRLRALPADIAIEPRVLSGFQVLFNRLDDRIADVIETGIVRGAYFRRVTLPRVANDHSHLVHGVRERFVPLTAKDENPVLATVRDRLRPDDTTPTSVHTVAPGGSRVALHIALTDDSRRTSSQARLSFGP